MPQKISQDDKTVQELKGDVLGYLEADRGSMGEQEFGAYKNRAFHIAASREEGGFSKDLNMAIILDNQKATCQFAYAGCCFIRF